MINEPIPHSPDAKELIILVMMSKDSHTQYLLFAGLAFLGACYTPGQCDSNNSSKPSKESALALELAAGQALYESNCAGCHNSGRFGAPKLGNREAWRLRRAEGENIMLKKAIAGIDGKLGMMPPKGGNATLTDEEIKMVIHYMISKIDTSEENPSIEPPVL